MTSPALMSDMPELPEIGALDWGPEVNACLVWLYEEMEANANSIAAQAIQIETLQGDVITLQGKVFTLEGEIRTLASQADDHDSRIVSLESEPEHIFSSTQYQFNNAEPPAGNNQVRFNHPDAKQVTEIDVRRFDIDGADRSYWFSRLFPEGQIRITDWDDSTIYHQFAVVGPAVVGSSNAVLSVVWVKGNGVIPNTKVDVGFLVTF